MKLRMLGLPVLVSSLMGFVFMGPQPASSQAPSPRPVGEPVPIAQDNLVPASHDPYGRYGVDSELGKLHLEEAQIEGKVHELLAQYGRAEKEGDKATIKKNLTAQLEKQFDLQQKRREAEVARIETQLKKLRDLIKKRTDNRSTIIDRHLDQLLQNAEGLGWSSSNGYSPYQSSYLVPSIATAAPQGR